MFLLFEKTSAASSGNKSTLSCVTLPFLLCNTGMNPSRSEVFTLIFTWNCKTQQIKDHLMWLLLWVLLSSLSSFHLSPNTLNEMKPGCATQRKSSPHKRRTMIQSASPCYKSPGEAATATVTNVNLFITARAALWSALIRAYKDAFTGGGEARPGKYSHHKQSVCVCVHAWENICIS